MQIFLKRILDSFYFQSQCFTTEMKVHNYQRTSDSLNEVLPIKMTREKFQRK